jgi:hypothetical protein
MPNSSVIRVFIYVCLISLCALCHTGIPVKEGGLFANA